MPALKEAEFRGNMVSKQLTTAVQAKFEEIGKKIEFKDIMEEEEEEEDEDDEEAKDLASKFSDLTI